MDLLTNPLVIAAGQWLTGYALKRVPSFPRWAIPVCTYVLALLGYSVAPPAVHAGTLADVLHPAGNIFLLALVQNLLITGTHSTMKNTVLPALSALMSWFGRK